MASNISRRKFLEKAGQCLEAIVGAGIAISPFSLFAGSIDKQIMGLEQEVKKKPDDKKFVELSNLYYEQGSLNGYGWNAQEAVRINPKNGEARHNLGYYYLIGGNYVRAESELGGALRNGFSNAAVYLRLGISQRSQNTPEKISQAIRSYKQARELNNKNPEIHYYLGEALFMRSGLDKARKEGSLIEATSSFGTAAQLDPENTAYPYHIGLCYTELSLMYKSRSISIKDPYQQSKAKNKALRFFNEAISHLDKVVKINPQSSYVRYANNVKQDLIEKFK